MLQNGVLKVAIPSDGALYEPTQSFLSACGLDVSRRNNRRYTAEIPTIPGTTVLFQRGADVTPKVEEGSADLGIVGRDRYLEMRQEGGSTNVVIESLGFGRCSLVIGVPDSWIDVNSLADIADLSLEFRESGRDLRVVTKYPRLVERFLLGSGVNFFSIVHSSGTLEAAPAMGFADIIVDVSESGTTMRENRLKTISGGTIMTSEACLISNRNSLALNADKLEKAGMLVDIVEAYLESKSYYSITANMKGESPDEVAQYVLEHTEISGLLGPTISQVYTPDGKGMFAVTVIIEKDALMGAVNRLRKIGGSSVTVSQPHYIFHSECDAQTRLIEKMEA